MLKIYLTILFLLFYNPLYAAPTDSELIKSTVQTFMEKNKIPGVAVEVYVNGKPASYYFGYADRDKKLPVTSHTIFEIGSLTKVMTSILLAEQVDKAKVQLDDPITKYKQNLPESFNKISLLNLATHTSGLPFEMDKSITNESALMNYFKNWQPSFAPDDKWIYSNVGIGLLGYTLNDVTHKNYNQLYRDEILKPLHMTLIGLDVPAKLRRDYAQGYDENDVAVKPTQTNFLASAHAMKATAADLQHFLAAAIGLKSTPEKILYPMRMTQTAYVKLSENEFQGLAWQIHLFNEKNMMALLNVPEKMEFGPKQTFELDDKPIFYGDALIDKTGATDGFHTYIALIPNKKTGIVILANKYVSNADIVKTGREILFQLAQIKNEDQNKISSQTNS